MQKITLRTLSVLLCFLVSVIANAQLFTPIPDGAANLTNDEMNKLNALRNNPDYESLTMVRVGNVFNLQQDGVLSVNLPGHPTMNAVVYDIENNDKNSSPQEFVWNGSFYEFITNEDDENELRFDGSIQLTKRNGEIFGTINPINSDDMYELASFAPGKNVLIKMNGTMLAGLTATGCSEGDPGSIPFATSGGGECNRNVRVLVLCTEAARASVPNINNTATQAMQLLDGAIYNSTNHAGGVKFIHAGTYFLMNHQFQETSGSWQTLSNLWNNATAQYLRNQYKADIVICLTKGDYDGNKYVGRAEINMGNSGAYGIVDADWANIGYTFAHEVGHLFGGRHQQQSFWPQDYDNTDDEAHGFLMTRGLFGQDIYNDIMSTQSADRQHMYSTPDVKIRKKAMGIAGSNNVTKVMLNNVCTISEYRSEENAARLSTGIVTNKRMYSYGETVWAAPRVYNSFGTLTHEWWMSIDGGVNYTYVGTTYNLSPINFAMPVTSNVIIWLKTTDGAGQYEVKTTVVSSNIVWGNPDCCSYYGAPKPAPTSVSNTDAPQNLKVSPNPAQNSLNITFPAVKKFTEDGRIELVDAVGRVVYSAIVPKSAADFNIDVTSLNAGIYFLKFNNGATSNVETVVIAK